MALNARSLVVLLAALLGAGLTARLGVWQLDRAAQKTALQQTLDSRQALAPLPASALATDAAQAAAQQDRRIVVTGRWLAEHTVYLDNRQMDAREGFYVVTPLLLADGSAVAVQRGWLPRNFLDRTQVSAPALPAGPVQVAGRIAPPPGRLYDFGGAPTGPIRQNLDLGAFAVEVGHALRPLSIVQLDGPLTPPDGLLRHWPHPAADVQRNYGYAFQWFAMATLILGLYAWFQLIRPRIRR
jgi:surfeit locus 1 family protein